MAHLRKAAAIIAALYLLVSLVLSCCISCGLARWSIIAHRAPFLLFDFSFTMAESVNGGTTGTDQHGEYIAFPPVVRPGDCIITVFAWNPLTTWCDDTIARWDFVIM